MYKIVSTVDKAKIFLDTLLIDSRAKGTKVQK